MPDIKISSTDVAAMKLGATNINKVMQGAVEVWPGAAACTDILSEPFNDLTNWAGSVGTIVAGRTGSGLQIVSSGGVSRTFTIPTANKSNYVTIGFALRVPSLANYIYALSLQSDAATVDQITMRIDTDGAITTMRGGVGSTILGISAAGVIAINTWYYIELQVYVADTGGYFSVRKNGVVVNGPGVGTYSPGDTRASGSNPIDAVALRGAWFSTTTSLWDDLYLSTGAGCAFKGDPNPPSPPGFKTALGQAVATTSGTTLVITTTAAIAVGDLVVVRVATDNLGLTTPTFTCADSGGNTYVTHIQNARNATATFGISAATIAGRATNAVAAGGTITVTLSGAVDARVAYAESFTGYTNTLRGSAAGVTGTSGAAAVAIGSILVGDLVVGTMAVESRTAFAGDSDTTGGTWSTLVQYANAATGTDTDCVEVGGQYKLVTAAGSQTYNATSVAVEYAAHVVGFQPA